MSHWIPDTTSLDAIAELVNIGVGRAAASLSDLIGQRIELSVPTIRVCQTDSCRLAILESYQQPETVITQTFQGMIRGRTSLCFPASSCVALAQILSGSPHRAAELDAELSAILLEVGNILLNGVMGSLSNAMSAVLQYSIPELQTADRRGDRMLKDALQDDDILIGDVRFHVSEHDIHGSIVIVFAVGSIRSMIESILQPAAA